MNKLDLNLIVILNVILTECNVTKAADKLNVSVSAMSRSLARLREITHDPLLVKTGRYMVLTPFAAGIKEQVAQLVYQAQHVLTIPTQLDLSQLEKIFTLRASDGFVENFGPDLLNYMRQQAPNVKLQIINKEQKFGNGLKEGIVDAEISVISDKTEQEMKSRLLFSDTFMGVAHNNHPLFETAITIETLEKYDFIAISRTVTQLKNDLNNKCSISHAFIKEPVMYVSGFSSALSFVKNSALIAIVPVKFTHKLTANLTYFKLPFPTPTMNISLIWHPRMDSDLAHKWFRDCILSVCRQSSTLSE